MYLNFYKIFIIIIMYYFSGSTEIFNINSNQLDILDGYLFNRINEQQIEVKLGYFWIIACHRF